ncbi:MFS transporter [Allosaccharopolyspora coralli]|uniref:MFS transporter n=1 Tax=Allosaccharopolyspora coralli TaxID=2665642 RepID=A0A5Q3Q752_9PSEU|nr:MFS transporter [Allosaccharopolyspora coralli]QGK70163.1 MFS transporter [Allosaccharopolyspora coralli]
MPGFRSSPAFRLLLAATALGFGSYALLLPVLPLWVATGGAGEFGAGLTTGVFMAGTVVTQLGVPRLLRAIGHRTVLLIGFLLLGLPSPLLALTTDLAPAVGVSAVRGIGFGMVTVAGSASVAELVTPSSHGRASARYGYAVAFPQLLFLPAGVAVTDVLGFTGVFVLAGVTPLIAAAVCLFLRVPAPRRPESAAPSRSRGRRGGVLSALRAGPVVALTACAVAQAGVITFGPLLAPDARRAVLATLFVLPLGMLVGRAISGTLTDRSQRPGGLLGTGTLLTAAGMLAVVASTAAPLLLPLGGALVGLGFGMVQNDAMVALFAAGPAHYSTASAAWNIGYDAGTGLGATALGALAEPFGIGLAFTGSVVLLLVVTPFVRVSRHEHRSPV